jgi:ferredoxin
MSKSIRWILSVDPSRCQGHNRCYTIAPELVDIDDYGNASAKGDGVVPEALLEKARLTVKNCPEHAVRLTQDN